ncbi:MAG: imidazole glycerol phosphate synthase subunit HisH [Rothia sp. (in: high G+C Gram-positive bacteria)]|nr:imidazole glycerol phosphate synthase subunit HisH [Rothia sp. (in: high G+C Gram-positive bacteria)]
MPGGAGQTSRDQRPVVVVLDYGAGNVHSALRALEQAGASALLSHQPEQVLAADGLLVPGVGAFKAVMEGLNKIQACQLIGRRIAGGRPVLGICVGLQIFFEYGLEHGYKTAGMGEWPGQVTKLAAEQLPHMGWNTVDVAAGSRLFEGVEDQRFYFVHSYGVQQWNFDRNNEAMPAPLVSWAHHGGPFIAALENGPLSATQFHPEKSGQAGLRLLQNWIKTLPRTGRLAGD